MQPRNRLPSLIWIACSMPWIGGGCAQGQDLLTGHDNSSSFIPDTTQDHGDGSDTGGTAGTSQGETTSTPTTSATSDHDDRTSSASSTSSATGSDNSSAEGCGNGRLEGDEACDGTDFGGSDCQSLGFVGGALQCSTACMFDTALCHHCGDATIDAGEDCDQTNLNGKMTCADLGLGSASEMLSCRSDCRFDLSMCGSCGDGTLMPPEDCEPGDSSGTDPDLNGQSCTSLGFDGGSLACTPGCGFDISGCYACGDGKKHPLEACDGQDFGQASCASFNAGDGKPFEAGNLSCSSACELATDGCWRCGDGTISGEEVCDGGNLGGNTCQSLDHSAGPLACANGCLAFNEAACTDCGDAVQEGSEQCDGPDLDGKLCKDVVGLGNGTLACSPTCTFDTKGCDMNSCGDGILNGSDACDCGADGVCTSAELANKTCTNVGFAGGTLGCNSPANCTFDTSRCYKCGDGKVNPGEACDGTDLAGKTCADVGDFNGGTLACQASCGFDTSRCTRTNRREVCIDVTSGTFNQSTEIWISFSLNETQVVKDVQVQLVITEDWVGEVFARLASPTKSSILLQTPGAATLGGFGCGGRDINAIFSDSASTMGNEMCLATKPTITGTVLPKESLSVHRGQSMKGSWAVRVSQIFEKPDSSPTGVLKSLCVWIDY